MKVAHLIMANKNPRQLARLVETMIHPNFYFYIHLDDKVNIEEYLYIGKYERVFFIKDRVVCTWGGFSFVKAILSSLNEILHSSNQYEFINLMSAQDYPIKPVRDIYAFLSSNVDTNFISYENDSVGRWWRNARLRFQKYHFTDYSFKGKYFLQNMINSSMPKRKFPLPLKLYGSSDSSWWTISSSCAAYIVKYMNENTKLEKFMKFTWGADEFLIATIIMNSPFKSRVINDNLRFITWLNGSPNPRILTSADFNDITCTDKLFSRKFDMNVDTEILDKIDTFIK